ncbi:MAG: HAMP domain-containing histidine kinase, partial [Ruminococcus bromii]
DYAESDENDSSVYLMYINIDHIVKYTHSLNWLISAIFLCAIVVMSIIGYRLGVKIEESQKTQRRFFQNSSHELKTPLMAIQGYAEGIEMDVVDPQNAAGIIMQETERMTGLVEEILSISKIDSRHFKLDLVKLDIKEVLYDCFRSLDAVQQMNGISIVPEFPDEEIYVKCDEDQMARAFRNIIINGLKYSKKKITVACETNQKYVYIRFKDDGNGINRDDIEHIFDRFYKGSDGGTGIGLSLANEIIHLHKGSVTAYNYLDGAVFEVKLPIID